MKVLLLNPHVPTSSHPVVQALQAQRVAVVIAENAQDAWQMLSLHGDNLDLAIIHRESETGASDEGGFEFIKKAKADPKYADLPILVTSHRWDDAEFAAHQSGSQGANAYLKWPYDGASLYGMIQAVFGESMPQPGDMPSSPSIPTAVGSQTGMQTGLQIEMPEPSQAAIEQVVAPSPSLAAAPPRTDLSNPAPSFELQVEPEAPELSQGIEHAASESEKDMPYLFGGASDAVSDKRQRSAPAAASAALTAGAFAVPVGNSVVPGGAAQDPDVETLKKYLLLREQDVAVLSSQLRATQAQLKAVEEQLRTERGRTSELDHVRNEQKRRLDDFEREKQQAMESLQAESGELRFQLKARADRAKVLESQVREAADEIERIKDRVRSDIRKIRVREKELENKLEITKKDSEALISARETKIIELKRKVDLLEFNMDLLQDQHVREKENALKLRERLAKAAQVVRVAGGLLDTPGGAQHLAAVLAGEAGVPGKDEVA